MDKNHPLNMSAYQAQGKIELIPASTFSYEELTDAYNHTRVDYLVPMPMNVKKLREYVETYDVDMDASAVAVDGYEVFGLGMLGVRKGRAWITRLGVIQRNRRQGAGQTLVAHLIQQARQKNLQYIVIEIIKNNTPAQNLFIKNGFQEIRKLLVLRRPPGAPNGVAPSAEFKQLGYSDAVKLLERRISKPSWLDEKESLMNAGNLEALYATLPDGSEGWLVYQNTVFQLGRLVLQTEKGNSQKVAKALLHYLHTKHPAQDTKTENLPADDPHWPILKEMGYIVMFDRIEMVLPLGG